jgi:bifunctional non-homologous end joining protein LigD
MLFRYVIHRHKTGRTHFDLRIIRDQAVQNWSLLKEPPANAGERRLAIRREDLPLQLLSKSSVEEEAFGAGRVMLWDAGDVDIREVSPECLMLVFRGRKMSGQYEMRLMRWYPGNRWMLIKTRAADRQRLG